MDVSLLLGATTLAATGFGIWGLVFHRKNGKETITAPWPPELAALLTHITDRLDTSLQRLDEASRTAQVAEVKETPDWSIHLMEHLEYLQEHMTTREPAPPRAWPPELVP